MGLPIDGQRRSPRRVLVKHPKTRCISFTGSRYVGLRIDELAAKAQPGQTWIERAIAEITLGLTFYPTRPILR